MTVKRAKIRINNKHGKKRTLVNGRNGNNQQRFNNPYNNKYNNNYNNPYNNKYNKNWSNRYNNQNNSNRFYYDKGNNQSYYSKTKNQTKPNPYQPNNAKQDKNYRYYYKDFNYVKKPKKKKFYPN